jgi:hypothetical protein
MELEPHLGHVIVCDRDAQGAARIFCVSCVEALAPETKVMTMPLTILEEEEEVPELCVFCDERPRKTNSDLCCACDCFKCDDCGGEFSDGDDYGGDGKCQTCWDDVAKDCAFCGTGHHEDGELCDECENNDNLMQCPACDAWFLKENGIEAEDNTLYCSTGCVE